MIHLKRAYDRPEPGDGARFLVDRIWPRGVKKEDLEIQDWLKDVAPSNELRKWFGHDPKPGEPGVTWSQQTPVIRKIGIKE
jgi:uncharacterized protein YeaO (DUF488 family)